MFDFENAAKVTGSKFAYFKGPAVTLEYGLVSWALSKLTQLGFKPIITPNLCKTDIVESCGFQPRDDSCN